MGIVKKTCNECGREFEFECSSPKSSRRMYCDECRYRRALESTRMSKRNAKRINGIVELVKDAPPRKDEDERVVVKYDDGRIIERIHHRGGGFYATFKRK